MVAPETKVPTTIGGRELFLRYDWGSLAEAQRAAGLKTYAELFAHLISFEQAASGSTGKSPYDIDLRTLGATAWAGALGWMAETGERIGHDDFTRSLRMNEVPQVLAAVVLGLQSAYATPGEDEKPAEGEGGNDPLPRATPTAEAA